MPFPTDYAERVYAGVLGKIIGVYLGRPFEGWPYERLTERFGEINYYVHEALNVPLVVTDDDISGTFTFLRALPDNDYDPNLTPAQIGETWLNYLIENRTVLWWGGMGNSTEHTAYLRLKHGLKAPESGAIATNGQVVAEQIGSQIFIDGWGMVCPGDPARAVDFARRAASVSHDGEAIYGAQVVAAMEAQAFVETDINKLLDTALTFIPADSTIAHLIADIRQWHSETPDDWRASRQKIADHYGYDKFGGNCHMVPNHGLIIHALLHGDGDFQKSLMIVNTCGWDTDCNSANVGCLLGIRGGLKALDNGPDWRGPVADRMYLPTADGGRGITDAATEALHVINTARALQNESPLAPKNGARFHFSFPGSVQGFQLEDSPEVRGTAQAVNGYLPDGTPALAITYRRLAKGRAVRVRTPTFVTPAESKMGGYGLIASPTLYPGQTVRAELEAVDYAGLHPEEGRDHWRTRLNNIPVTIRLYLSRYNEADELLRVYGPPTLLSPNHAAELTWAVPDCQGFPVAEVGVEITSDNTASGTVFLNYLTWDGTPDVALSKPIDGGTAWKRAWVDGVDHFEDGGMRLIQDEGVGLISQGTREWTDYTASATLTPHMAASCGLCVRVQGMRRYYALRLTQAGKAQLVRARDGDTVLAETDLPLQLGRPYTLELTVQGQHLRGSIDSEPLFDIVDDERPLTGGGIGLLVEEGRVACADVRVRPATS